MFLHSGETSAIVAPTLAKEPIMKTAVKKSKRPMPRPSEGRMGELRERAKETAEMDRLEGLITGGTDYKSQKEDLKAAKGMMGGGMVKGYKNGGCVMSGRGGKYKGAM
jgi:hypothetical protein